MTCLICNKEYIHLGAHVHHGHKITAREYRVKFGLTMKEPLVDPELHEKLKANYDRRSDEFKTSIVELGKEYRFKPGVRTGKRQYISTATMKRHIDTITKVNEEDKPRICPVCNLKTKALPSHLYNKHRLLQVD